MYNNMYNNVHVIMLMDDELYSILAFFRKRVISIKCVDITTLNKSHISLKSLGRPFQFEKRVISIKCVLIISFKGTG